MRWLRRYRSLMSERREQNQLQVMRKSSAKETKVRERDVVLVLVAVDSHPTKSWAIGEVKSVTKPI